jgi:hypothetical protein
MWLSWDLFLGSTLRHQLSKRSLQCRTVDGIVSIDALHLPWRPVNLGGANSRSITVDERPSTFVTVLDTNIGFKKYGWVLAAVTLEAYHSVRDAERL